MKPRIGPERRRESREQRRIFKPAKCFLQMLSETRGCIIQSEIEFQPQSCDVPSILVRGGEIHCRKSCRTYNEELYYIEFRLVFAWIALIKPTYSSQFKPIRAMEQSNSERCEWSR